MNKIVFRFYVVKDNYFFEVCFDSRLSFIDNFKLLNEIYKVDISNLHIYDDYAKRFVSLNTPINRYHFVEYTKLMLF